MGGLLSEFASWLVSLFGGFGAWFASGLLARVLTGAGLSLVYFSGAHVLFSSISGLVMGYGGAPAALVDMLGLMGLGSAFNIIVAAYGVRVTMLSMHKVFLAS